MPQINYEDYEALTVAELKEMADQQGVEIPHDARKADIIDALKAAEGKERPEGGPAPKDEGDNVYNFSTSSTTVATISHDDFWKLKLTA